MKGKKWIFGVTGSMASAVACTTHHADVPWIVEHCLKRRYDSRKSDELTKSPASNLWRKR